MSQGRCLRAGVSGHEDPGQEPFPDQDVDLGRVVKKGDRYRVVSVQDYFGRSVLEGRYNGGPVRIPVKPVSPARPVGMDDFRPPVTGPEFDVFVVLPAEESRE